MKEIGRGRGGKENGTGKERKRNRRRRERQKDGTEGEELERNGSRWGRKGKGGEWKDRAGGKDGSVVKGSSGGKDDSMQ